VKTFWIVLAGVGGVAAAYFVFQGDYEMAFVAAAGGAVCWFLNYRQQIRESLASEDEQQEEEDSDEEVHS
jgi:hypothetical protein